MRALLRLAFAGYVREWPDCDDELRGVLSARPLNGGPYRVESASVKDKGDLWIVRNKQCNSLGCFIAPRALADRICRVMNEMEAS